MKKERKKILLLVNSSSGTGKGKTDLLEIIKELAEMTL
jgi:hypothetical protein